jgi:hypothetical protein
MNLQNYDCVELDFATQMICFLGQQRSNVSSQCPSSMQREFKCFNGELRINEHNHGDARGHTAIIQHIGPQRLIHL